MLNKVRICLEKILIKQGCPTVRSILQVTNHQTRTQFNLRKKVVGKEKEREKGKEKEVDNLEESDII